jgi:hypothetical protein
MGVKTATDKAGKMGSKNPAAAAGQNMGKKAFPSPTA